MQSNSFHETFTYMYTAKHLRDPVHVLLNSDIISTSDCKSLLQLISHVFLSAYVYLNNERMAKKAKYLYRNTLGHIQYVYLHDVHEHACIHTIIILE